MHLSNSSGDGSLWIFAFPAVLLSYALVRRLLHWWNARNWELVTGRIEHAAFARFAPPGAKGPHNQKVGAKIDYSFIFESERYGGFIGVVGLSSETAIDEYVRSLLVGAPIYIRFDKVNPDSSEARLSDNPQLYVDGVTFVHKQPYDDVVELLPK